MDHSKILKRALQITWNYRVLWVFGFLLALTSIHRSSSGNGGGSSGGRGSIFQPYAFDFSQLGYLSTNGLQMIRQAVEFLIPLIIIASVLVLILVVVFTALRYISETALVRLVDSYETTGEKASIREGFRLGWSRKALRIFLIDLLFLAVILIAVILLLLISAAPFLVYLTNSQALHVIGSVLGIGLVFLVILVTVLVVIALSVVIQFIRRAAIMEDMGVIESIRRGFSIVFHHLGDVVIMGIILFALGLVFLILMIPVVLLLLLVGVVLGGLPALIVGGIASIFLHGNLPYIIGGLFGLPIFLLTVVLPALFISGLFEVFKSSTWTLTYRELLAIDTVQPETPAPPEEPQPAS